MTPAEIKTRYAQRIQRRMIVVQQAELLWSIKGRSQDFRGRQCTTASDLAGYVGS